MRKFIQRRRITLLAALCGGAAACWSPTGAQVFSDVPKGHWASMEAEWLASRGLVEGWNGKLHGDEAMTRFHAVEFLYRIMSEFEDYRMVSEARLSALESSSARLTQRVDFLFESAGKNGLKVPPKMRQYQAERTLERTGSTGSATPKDAGVVRRLKEIHDRVGLIRKQGIEAPVLVVPPGASAQVSLPEVLMDDRPARFDEGVHILHWGARIEVPAGSTVSVLLPEEDGGLMLLERTRGTLNRRGFRVESGSPAPVTVEAAD